MELVSFSSSAWPLCCACFVAYRWRLCACVACMFVGGSSTCLHVVGWSVLSCPPFLVGVARLVSPLFLLSVLPLFLSSSPLLISFFFFVFSLSLSLYLSLSLFPSLFFLLPQPMTSQEIHTLSPIDLWGTPCIGFGRILLGSLGLFAVGFCPGTYVIWHGSLSSSEDSLGYMP